MSRKTKFVFLQIKIKSLAAEGAMIHREERKWPKPSQTDTCFVRGKLREHRVIALRKEARAAQLAYGFLRNRPYRSIEPFCYEVPDLARVARIAVRFAGGEYREKVDNSEYLKYFKLVSDWRAQRPTDADRPGTSNPSVVGSTPAGRANPEKGLMQRVIGVIW